MDTQAFAEKGEIELLRPEMTMQEVVEGCREGMRRKVRVVWVWPCYVALAARELKGTGVRTGSVAGYPLGVSKVTIKAIEASSAVKDGASEVIVSPWLVPMLGGDLAGVRTELMEITRAARAASPEAVLWVDVSRVPKEKWGLAGKAGMESGFDGVRVTEEDVGVRKELEGMGMRVGVWGGLL